MPTLAGVDAQKVLGRDPHLDAQQLVEEVAPGARGVGLERGGRVDPPPGVGRGRRRLPVDAPVVAAEGGFPPLPLQGETGPQTRVEREVVRRSVAVLGPAQDGAQVPVGQRDRVARAVGHSGGEGVDRAVGVGGFEQPEVPGEERRAPGRAQRVEEEPGGAQLPPLALVTGGEGEDPAAAGGQRRQVVPARLGRPRPALGKAARLSHGVGNEHVVGGPTGERPVDHAHHPHHVEVEPRELGHLAHHDAVAETRRLGCGRLELGRQGGPERPGPGARRTEGGQALDRLADRLECGQLPGGPRGGLGGAAEQVYQEVRGPPGQLLPAPRRRDQLVGQPVDEGGHRLARGRLALEQRTPVVVVLPGQVPQERGVFGRPPPPLLQTARPLPLRRRGRSTSSRAPAARGGGSGPS